jgi:hypothetical protein
MTERTPTRFRISWDKGAYYVSIPNYQGGEVVPASIADDLVKALEAMLVDPPATLDEPDTDAEVIIKMRAIARDALALVKGAPDRE